MQLGRIKMLKEMGAPDVIVNSEVENLEYLKCKIREMANSDKFLPKDVEMATADCNIEDIQLAIESLTQNEKGTQDEFERGIEHGE